MCLIAFAWGASERFPFVIAANRDEFLARPTAPLAPWQTPAGVNVISGRDLRDGGTWMGFSTHGRFAMLTNVRNSEAPAPEQTISRGTLALSWLESQLDVDDWSATLEPQRYQGFNLIVGDAPRKTCFYLSNQRFTEDFEPYSYIKQGKFATHLVAYSIPLGQVYGLSNAALDTPWPKTQQLKTSLLRSLQAQSIVDLQEECLATLRNAQPAPDHALPRTGVPIELERSLSSIFVSHPLPQPSYGTRSSLVAVCDASGSMSLTEITHSHDGEPAQFHEAQLLWM